MNLQALHIEYLYLKISTKFFNKKRVQKRLRGGTGMLFILNSYFEFGVFLLEFFKPGDGKKRVKCEDK